MIGVARRGVAVVGLFPHNLIEILAATFVLAAGAAVQGSVGFAYSLVAAPFLVLIDPRWVPGPIILSGVALNFLIVRRERSHVDIRGVTWALAGRVPGSVIGGFLLAMLSPKQTGTTVGAMVWLAVLLSISGLRMRPNAPSLLGAGLLSGFMGTTSSLSGPPVALVYQNVSGPRLRGTLTGYFLVGSIISLIVLAWAGRFGLYELVAALVFLPGTIAGFAVSRLVAPLLDRAYTRPAVLFISAAGATLALVRSLF